MTPGVSKSLTRSEAVNAIKRHQRFTVVVGNPPYSVNSANKKSPIDAKLAEYKKGLTDERNLKPLNDDYVKFIRYVHLVLLDADRGIFGMITNHSYATARLFRSMRRALLRDFHKALFLDLRGDMNRDPEMARDENVFDIQQGVGIGIYCRTASKPPIAPIVQTHELTGTRIEKNAWLEANSMATTPWTTVAVGSELYSFAAVVENINQEYKDFFPLNRLFEVGNVGYQTHRDEFVIDLNKNDLLSRLSSFGQADGDEAQLTKRFGVQSNRDWSLLSARKELRKDKHIEQRIQQTLYRPFDIRYICYVPYLIDYDRHQLMDHMQTGNVGLLLSKVFDEHEFTSVFVTRWIVESKVADRTRGSYLFPLRLRNNIGQMQLGSGNQGVWRTNLTQEGASWISKRLGIEVQFENSAQQEDVTGVAIFDYIYALLYAPTYRSRYADFLKIDFPRFSMTRNLKLFRALARLGAELVALHLLESAKLHRPNTEFIGSRNPEVDKVSWLHQTVWLDKAQTEGFKGVPEAVWNYHVGGYQVCEKWLKDRKGRALSKDDIAHYQKIVVALAETILLMKKIDEVIDTHGGWPGAFSLKEQKTPVLA